MNIVSLPEFNNMVGTIDRWIEHKQVYAVLFANGQKKGVQHPFLQPIQELDFAKDYARQSKVAGSGSPIVSGPVAVA